MSLSKWDLKKVAHGPEQNLTSHLDLLKDLLQHVRIGLICQTKKGKQAPFGSQRVLAQDYLGLNKWQPAIARIQTDALFCTVQVVSNML